MKIEVETKADYVYIQSQVWYERVFMHFLHVQYLTLENKINALENICNTGLCY